MPQRDAVQIGPHLTWSEDDISVVIVYGTLDGEQTAALNAANISLLRRYGYNLSLVDATHATGMTAEARRVAAQFRRDYPVPSANALFGVSLMMRGLATIMYRGLALLLSAPQRMEMFKTEVEARAWLAKQRPRLRVQAGQR
jgi:hypothetical protein